MKTKKDSIKREYSFVEVLSLGFNLIRTKCLNKNIRLIRFPIILRGKKYIDFGNNLTTGKGCRIEALRIDEDKKKRITFGNNIQINDYVHISGMNCVSIGDNCLLASHIYISDNSHGNYNSIHNATSPKIPPTQRDYVTAPVTIGKNVWIGEGVIILPGIQIGEGSIIGAHAVVNKDIPSYSIAVGSPARVVKQFDFKKKCWVRI